MSSRGMMLSVGTLTIKNRCGFLAHAGGKGIGL